MGKRGKVYPSKNIFWLLFQLANVPKDRTWNPSTLMYNGGTTMYFTETDKHLSPDDFAKLIKGLVKYQTANIITSTADILIKNKNEKV
jgi:hypothetical protein